MEGHEDCVQAVSTWPVMQNIILSVYRRYASLFFVFGIGEEDNELITLETMHRYVELLDKYFESVSEILLVDTGSPLQRCPAIGLRARHHLQFR